MGIAATVASKEVRNSFVHVRVQSSQILHILRFITVTFFFLIPLCVPVHKALVKKLTALSRIHLKEKIKTILLNSVDGQKKYSLQHREHYVWRHFLSVRGCLLKLKVLMTLAL